MRHCEWSSQLTSNFMLGSAQAKETGFLGSLLQVLLGGFAQAKETGFLGSLPQTLPCCSAQARETAFLGSLPKALRVGSAQTPGQAEPIFTRPLVLRFRLRACAPINRQSPQRASSRLERGALWRSLAQPCARNPRNVSV